jgi:prolyl oligopeptidase
MNRGWITCSLFLLGGAVVGLAASVTMDRLNYPQTKKQDLVEDLHGVRVADPYRWLEDPNSDETKAWVQAQNRVTFDYLGKIPERDRIKDRLTELWNYERYGIPVRRGEYYFFSRNDGLQNQPVLYVMKGLNGTPRVLLDPNALSEDGTVALSGTSFSRDGRYLAYSISKGGSDWQEWRVREVETGADTKDLVQWAKFTGAAWTNDNSGFFYSRYEAPKEGDKLSGVNYYHKLYFHRLGSPQSEDVLVYERPDEREWGFGGFQTEDGKYLVVNVWHGTHRENRVFYRKFEDAEGEFVEMLADADASYSFLGNDGGIFYFLTDLNAPLLKVIAIDTQNPAPADWIEVVPEAKETLESASIVGDQLFLNYLKDAHTLVRVYNLDGRFVRDVDLPGVGSAGGFGGLRDQTETFYSYTDFTTPPAIYRYDLDKGQSDLFRSPQVAFDPDDYETKQAFYQSKDGTRVPLFVTHRKGMALDGNNPTLLYGYGGFNSSMTPFFSQRMMAWMEMGGVFAVASIRGGGEYGTAWHDAGRLHNKQNVFDDFIAAAEWLVDQRYTQPSKLAIHGGSNGGLLVGAVVNQRPDLFGAAIPAVGVMDMLRFHKFTIGWAWVSDYGSPDEPEGFKTLLAYSPLHNLKEGTRYPAVLVMTGDHDDRVVPAHSFKYIAALQAAQAGEAPVLIRIETSAGHGAGKPTSKAIEETADMWAFLVKNLGMRLD